MSTTVEDIEALREATRGLHEAIHDARLARRELEAAAAKVRTEFDSMFDKRAVVVIEEGLRVYQHTIAKQIDKATDAVFHRFDTVCDTLLGEGWRNRRKPTFVDNVREYRKRQEGS